MSYDLRLLDSSIVKLSLHEKCRIWSFSGLHFPVFKPEKLRIRTLFTGRSNIIRFGVTRKKFP